jgi:sialate O-acetylesterase
MKKHSFMPQLNNFRLRQIFIILLFLGCVIQNNKGQTVTMPNIIGSNMVLQQNTQVPLWGWATAGTSVVISASWGQTATVVTPASGKWMTKIQTPVAVPGQAPTYTVTVTGPSNTLTFTNILVGEVWLCSGQSNMYYPLGNLDAGSPGVVNYAAEVAAANYPNIRFFQTTLATPNQLAAATTPQANCGGSWSTCTPTTAAAFSAVAYYFGRELYNNPAVNVPIGLLHDSYGGTTLQAWIKDSVLRADAATKTLYIDGTKATALGIEKPSLVYNAMLAPIIPFAIKGAIWYQGESNVGNTATYTKGCIAMIKDWRASWGTDFSFYGVQLTPRISSLAQIDTTTDRGFFREFQSGITAIPKTGMVVTSDLMQLTGKDERILTHPTGGKKEIGLRLAYQALAKDYAQPIQCYGPMYESFTIEGNKVRIKYKAESIGTGLESSDGLPLQHFRIAGAQKGFFYPALAVIEGNTVVVSSPYVTVPIAVRYAFTDGAMVNLRNKNGLPAYEFRTDAFDQYWQAMPFRNLPVPTATAVEDVQNENGKLFPNPFNNVLYVSGISEGIRQIEVYDIMGRKVKTQLGQNASDATINVASLAKGIYSVRITPTNSTPFDVKAIKK